MVVLVAALYMTGGVSAAADVDLTRAGADSRSVRLDTSADRCPFDFRNGMPPTVFCVYEGVATGSFGQVCSGRTLAIWTRLAAELAPNSRRDESGVYFGFVTAPDLVVRGEVAGTGNRHAALLEYTFGPDRHRVRLHGTAELAFVPIGDDGTETLRLHLLPPVMAPGICPFTSFDGTFVGVMTIRS